VIHVSLVAAVQLQPVAVVTVTDPVPPVREKLAAPVKSHTCTRAAAEAGSVDTILLTVPPSPTTYSSPLSSSPNDEMFSAVSSNTGCDGPPVQPKISPEQ
jgi:hypothetical protein